MAIISITTPSDGQTIDASDVNNPLNTIVNEINGNLDNANIKTGAAIDGAKIADNSIDIGAKASTWDGWIEGSGTWTYASATTFTVPSADAAVMSVGTKIKLTQTTVKYFYVKAISGTTITVGSPNGSVVANATITAPYYSNAATPVGYPTFSSFVEIGRTTLSGAGDTISVTGLPAMKYLKAEIVAIATGGNINLKVRFNNDATANYSWRRYIGASSGTPVDTISSSVNEYQAFNTTSAATRFHTYEILNVATLPKIISGRSVSIVAGAGNAPGYAYSAGQWANTSDQINRIDVINDSTGDFAIGSEIVVYGKD